MRDVIFSPDRALRVGLWGPFGERGLRAALEPAIFEAEMRRRLGPIEVLVGAPGAADLLPTFDPGSPVLSLGHSVERAAALAAGLDAVAVSGPLCSPETTDSPTVDPTSDGPRGPALLWHAVSLEGPVSGKTRERLRIAASRALVRTVRDEATKALLESSGIAVDAVVVPDLLLLSARAFDERSLARRVRYLRIQEALPEAGIPVVVVAGEALVPHLPALSEALSRPGPWSESWILVLDSAGPFGDAPGKTLESRVHRLPGPALGDLVAALSQASVVIAGTKDLAPAGRAFGVPVVEVGAPGSDADLAASLARVAPSRGPGPSAEEQALLARHFDRMADAIAASLKAKGSGRSEASAEARRAMLWKATADARARLGVEERFRLAERLDSSGIKAAELERALATVEQLRRDETEAARTDTEMWRREVAESTARLAAEIGRLTAELKGWREQFLSAEREIAGQKTFMATSAAEVHEARVRIAELTSQLREVKADHDLLAAETARVHAEAARLANLRIFRYSAPLRGLYAAIRRFVGLRRPGA